MGNNQDKEAPVIRFDLEGPVDYREPAFIEEARLGKDGKIQAYVLKRNPKR